MKIQMKTENLKEIYQACKTFVSKDVTRLAPTVIRLQCKGDVCTATALDGYKMMEVTVPSGGDEGTMLIPIVRVPKASVVVIEETENEIVFDFITEKQIVKKIEGEFMKTDHYWEGDKFEFEIGFDPKLLHDAMEGFKGETAVKFSFTSEIGKCIVTAGNKKALVLPVKLKG